MKLNFVGMGMDVYDAPVIEVLKNYRIRTKFHAKYGTPIFLEATDCPVYKYTYTKGGREIEYKKPRLVSRWGLHVYCHRHEGADPCNEYRLYDDVIEGAFYTEKDLLEWINRHFGTNFDGIYIADQFDEFTTDMFSEDWEADKGLHDKRKEAYDKYFQYVKDNSKDYPYEGRFYYNRHKDYPCLSVVELTPTSFKVINHSSEAELEYCGLEREVILEVK